MMTQSMTMEDGQDIILVHFVYKEGRRYRIACSPHLPEIDMTSKGKFWSWYRTEELRSVTCPLCRRTEAFHKAREQFITLLGDDDRL